MNKPVAAVDRPLALRLRPDLVEVPVEMADQTTWVIKDPVTLEHFQFSPEEYALLEMLRQPISLAKMQREFARQFTPQTMTPEALWSFVGRLHDAGLLVSDAEGQGHELLARARREQLRKWSLAWTQLLAIRFRGIDPDAFITALHNRCRWLFSPVTLVALLSVVLYAASLIATNFSQFLNRLPELSAFLDTRNLLWLLAVIGCVKILHELGHAMMCKHFGGEVRTLGLMFLVFAPCLYCDVTDAWRFPSKWQRILVSAAGMMVEIFLASVATIIWWHAEPGAVGLVALNVMIVCSVSTLAFNGNPLMRFDGYYILSDLVEAPNLWQRSRDVLSDFASRWVLGLKSNSDPLLTAGRRAWLAAYGLASKTYMIIVFTSILCAIITMLYPLHLENLAYMIGLVIVGTALAGPAMAASRLLGNPMRRRQVRKGRASLVMIAAAAVLVALLAWPVTYYVYAPLVLMPDGATRVYATTAGTLETMLPVGAEVQSGDVIVTMDNAETDLELTRLEGELELQQLRIDHLQSLRGHDPTAGDQIPAAESMRADIARQLEDRRRDAQRLTLVAQTDGIVLPAPRIPAADAAGRLPTWSGTALDPRNAGAHVEPGTLVCMVGDPRKLSVVLLVDDTDVKRITRGQNVRMLLEQLPGQVIEGQVFDVARRDLRPGDSAAAHRADLASLWAGLVPAGRTAVHYQAQVDFDVPAQDLIVGGRGRAKVATERITIARLLMRYLAQTFRLPM